jgi:adenylate cyclase
VLAAVAVQYELSADGVPVRIGVHTGEVTVEPERLTGDAVNIAVRIESLPATWRRRLRVCAGKEPGHVGVVSLGRFKLKSVGCAFELHAISAI